MSNFSQSNVVPFTRYLNVTWMPLVDVRRKVKELGWTGFRIDWKQSGDDKCIIERTTERT